MFNIAISNKAAGNEAADLIQLMFCDISQNFVGRAFGNGKSVVWRWNFVIRDFSEMGHVYGSIKPVYFFQIMSC